MRINKNVKTKLMKEISRIDRDVKYDNNVKTYTLDEYQLLL